jgi:hypothetical protein
MINLNATSFTALNAARAARSAGTDIWRSSVQLAQANGGAQMFSLGPDGHVWQYLLGKYEGTGSRMRPTGLDASTFNACSLADGRRVVVAAIGLELRTVCETAPGSCRWGEPQAAGFYPLRGSLCIDKIMLKASGAQLLVGLLTQRASEVGYRLVDLWDGAFNGQHLNMGPAPTRARMSGHSVWQELLDNEIPELSRQGPGYCYVTAKSNAGAGAAQKSA